MKYMNTAKQTIQEPVFKEDLQLVEKKSNRDGMITKIKVAFLKVIGPSHQLDYETWKNLEFRNERGPERTTRVQLERWN